MDCSQLIRLNSKYHKKLIGVSRPFLECLGIEQLCFDYTSADGRFWALNTNPHLHEYYFNNHGLQNEPIDQQEHTNAYHIWSTSQDLKYNDILKDFSTYFQIENGISVTRILDDGAGIGVSFGGRNSKSDFINKIIIETELVDGFISYLYKNFYKLILESNNEGLPIYSLISDGSTSAKDTSLSLDKRCELLLSLGEITEEHLYLKEIKLTDKQKACAQLILQGYSGEDASYELGISLNVVNERVRALRNKLKVKTKSELRKQLVILKKMNILRGVFKKEVGVHTPTSSA